jgi:hypothetical protein
MTRNNTTEPENEDLAVWQDAVSDVAKMPTDSHVVLKTEKKVFHAQKDQTVPLRLFKHDVALDTTSAVRRFMIRSYLASKRCVIIVTGKGSPHQDEDVFAPRGVLKDRVPQWLATDELRQLILTYIHPSERLGGQGALYILLRRQR